jgi:apolipoprotein N-acyltransferase
MEKPDAPDSALSFPLWIDILLAVFGGLLAYLSFHPVGQSWLVWIALSPMLFLLHNRGFGRSIVMTQLGCLVFFYLSLLWVTEVTFAGMTAIAVIIAVVYCGLFAVIVRLGMKRTPLPFGVLVVAAWILIVEFARSEQPVLSFHWIILGHALWDWLPVIQISDIGGTYLVSALVLLVNLAVMRTLENILRRLRGRKEEGATGFRNRRYLLLAGGTVAAIVATLVYGFVRPGTLTIIEGPKIVSVQGNIPQNLKEMVLRSDNSMLAVEFEHKMLDDYLRLMSPALEEEGVDLVVWPETMVPGRIVQRADIQQLLVHYARRIGCELLIGSQHYDIDCENQICSYNSCFFFDREGKLVGRYDKSVLVPVGEFIPFKFIPLMRNFLGRLTPYGASDFSTGTPGTVFTSASGMKFAPLICFEISMPSMVRNARNKGCDAVLNISNDAWFHDSAELDLSLAQAVFRAIENRMGVLRAVNTGISAFVRPDGTYRELAVEVDGKPKRKQVEGTLIDRLSFTRNRTLYSILGDWFVWLCLAVVFYVVFVAAASGLRGRKKKRESTTG